VIPESSGSIARFKFSDLCDKPLSAADYLELTGRYGTVIVEAIPRLGLGERDQARRFITFVDGMFYLKLAGALLT
jgi:protein AFG1